MKTNKSCGSPMPNKPFEEAANPVTEDVATRSSINAASLRESAGIANVNNPYSSANMQKAAIQLSKLYGTPPRPVHPTHDYVRFLPQDSTQVDILEEELKLELVSYPLERELSDQEVEFYSNDLINGYTWLYGVVPKNFRYPSGIRYEVLQDACLESDDPLLRSEISPATVGGGTTGGTVGTGATWYDEVLAQSMKNAGIPIIGNGPSSTGGWTPQAIVTCYDDATNQRIPLQGVKVRVSTLLNVGIGYTDKDGMVNIPKGRGGKFKNAVRYEIQFENDYWKIKNAIKQVATIQSPKTNKSWLYYISPENKELSAYGVIHRALYYFYFKQNIITKPTYFAKRLKIKTLWDQTDPDKAGLFSPPRTITVWGKSPYAQNEYYNRHQIMRTTLHELGHASHYKYSGKDYNNDGYVSQSYADAVAYYCLSQLYPDPILLENIKKEYDPKNPEYTQIGESLFNQGLTMAQLQSSVKSAFTWDQWRQAVKSVSSLPDWLVDFLFANRELTFEYSLVNGSIEHELNNYLAYENYQARFNLHQHLIQIGATVKSWWSSCPEYKVVEQTPEYAKFTFPKTGTYLLYATVQLPDGTTFRAQRSFRVKNLPTVIGPRLLRVGVSYTYDMDDWSFSPGFKIGNLNSFGNFVETDRSNYLSLDYTGNLDLVFFNPGDYIIRSINYMGGAYVNIDYPITVRAESMITDDNRYGAGIYTVSAYRHKTDKNIKQIFWDRKTIFYPATYSHLGDEYNFKAYTLDIPSDHPYYTKLRTIHKHAYNGLEAYSQGLLYATDRRTIITNGGTPVFKVLKEQVPGSVPLYSMDLKTEQNGKVISQCRYMSLVNLRDGYTQEGNYTYYLTNMELLGYVFPLQ